AVTDLVAKFDRSGLIAALAELGAGEMAQAARARIHPPAVPIYASDVAFRMVDFARRNAERAGVAQYIQFNGGDALE
uniref:hypothetical protein n=1 Tax=Escherichia coli TaxID=562 RepID=UPI0019530BC6